MLTNLKVRLEVGTPFFLGAIPEKNKESHGLRYFRGPEEFELK
jgi:hypothetical protein